MKTDAIAEIGIDGQQRLYVKPAAATFPHIYREAMEVHWEPNARVLYAPKPREWAYFDWFRQIVKAAAEQSCELTLAYDTKWHNVTVELRSEIEAWMAAKAEVAHG